MEAIIGFKKRGETLNLEDILVVSLGTGSLTRQYFYDEAKSWGKVGWIQPLTNITLDGASESVACQLDQLLPNAEGEPKQYYRFQAFLSPSCEPMDSTAHTEELEDIANKIITQEEEDGDLEELCNQRLETPSS